LSVSPKLLVGNESISFKEETDMAYPTLSDRALQQAIPNGCPAKALWPKQRQQLGLQALAETDSISHLARQFTVSRKFVYRQAHRADTALTHAFAPAADDPDPVLFHLPVTKQWLRQATLGLVLICHSSLRGVVEFYRDLFDYRLSVGTVHTILQDAVTQARRANEPQALANVRIAAHDEIFQNGQPVLVGADVASTYCYLLSQEVHRDADTWGLRLLELQDQGFAPQATIADFAGGLRAGQRLAMPEVPCRGDVFHALYEITPLVRTLENRAYEAMEACQQLEQQKAKRQRQGHAVLDLAQKLRHARPAEAQAIALADDVALLVRWLQRDLFAVSALAYADRCALYDFVVAELRAREAPGPRGIRAARCFLENHRDELLEFAAQLDRDLAALAHQFQVPLALVRELLRVKGLDPRQPRRWKREATLRQQLRDRYGTLNTAVEAVVQRTVRASSVIENLNSRLRNYFFLRRHLGADYLAVLQFFLNHRRFLRSERVERVEKSPAELLTGQRHPHWLEMLGYTQFTRN
jgi:hypothetical protein